MSTQTKPTWNSDDNEGVTIPTLSNRAEKLYLCRKVHDAHHGVTAYVPVGVPAGWKLVPIEPTEKQWGGLARDIIMWTRMADRPTGKNLHYHLKSMGRKIPQWLADEIEDIDYVPAKGTVAVVIYKAMLAAYETRALPQEITQEETK